MPVLVQLCIIFSVYLGAEVFSAVMPFTFPASVAGIVLFLILLFTRALKPHQLKESSDFMLQNMALFFVPVAVSALKYLDVLLENIWAIILICVVTTPIVFFVTGHAVQLTMKLVDKRRKNI